MTMELFLQELEKNLHGLKSEERQNALAYYREYLEEAGDAVEQALENLGSPQSVAQRILSESAGISLDSEMMAYLEHPENSGSPDARDILFGVSVILLTSPFWLTAVFIWLMIVFTLAMIALTFAASAILAPVQGIVFLTNHLLGDGLWNIGAGLLCAGVTMLIWKPCLNGIVKSSQFSWKQTVHVCKKLFRKENHI
ncbi:MAG: DUF1700 domain-containing protein [Oscillospiraceae bacterium]|nr:DUF1700 domain-containing protein [Oscillospiraceae bacterium]